MTFLKWMLVFVVSIGSSISVASECKKPKLPKSLDGKSASADEAKAIKKAVDEFQDKSSTYLECLDKAAEKAKAAYSEPYEEVNKIEVELEPLRTKVSKLGEDLKKNKSSKNRKKLYADYEKEYAKYQKVNKRYKAAYRKYEKLYEEYNKKTGAYNDEVARANEFMKEFNAQYKIFEDRLDLVGDEGEPTS